MKIDLAAIDRTCFDIKSEFIAGEKCFLVTPNKDKSGLQIKWTQENKIFRSSVWTSAGEPVSLLFGKFTNYGEQPLFEPLDLNQKLTYIAKHDGSLFGFSTFRD